MWLLCYVIIILLLHIWWSIFSNKQQKWNRIINEQFGRCGFSVVKLEAKWKYTEDFTEESRFSSKLHRAPWLKYLINSPERPFNVKSDHSSIRDYQAVSESLASAAVDTQSLHSFIIYIMMNPPNTQILRWFSKHGDQVKSPLQPPQSPHLSHLCITEPF